MFYFFGSVMYIFKRNMRSKLFKIINNNRALLHHARYQRSVMLSEIFLK